MYDIFGEIFIFPLFCHNLLLQYFLLMVSLLISLLAVTLASLAVDKRKIIGKGGQKENAFTSIIFSQRIFSTLHFLCTLTIMLFNLCGILYKTSEEIISSLTQNASSSYFMRTLHWIWFLFLYKDWNVAALILMTIGEDYLNKTKQLIAFYLFPVINTGEKHGLTCITICIFSEKLKLTSFSVWMWLMM